MSFVHLHTHTEYSLLDGSNKIKDYIARVKELGMNSAAITDHGVMYGVIDFYKEAKANGINPVLGCEVYVAPGSRFEKPEKRKDRYYHLILLAENNEGYGNLIKIVSAGFKEGFYYKPRVDMDILKQYHNGIICLSACIAGEVPQKILAGNYEGAKEAALRYLDIFGEGNYFLELQDHGMPEQKAVNAQLLKLSRETGVPLVATNDCHYTRKEDADAHEILLCIQTKKKITEDHMVYEGGQYYVKSEEEMRSLFPYAQDAVLRTQEIAGRCHVEIEFHKSKLPKFDAPVPFTSTSYLTYLCLKGFNERYPDKNRDLKQRLYYELSVIKSMGYVDYFLIVWDFINYAKRNGIAVGPGRGSAAGSLVSYCLNITNIDPVKYDLIFERFLNPERVSMPDIDVDFCVERRGEVIDYVMDKYGKDCVSQIVTFGTLGARSVIRDVGRVLDLPYSYCDSLAKMIPKVKDVTIDLAMEQNPDFANLYKTDEKAKRLIDVSRKLEGLPRNSSMHAAGVVICSEPIDEYVPLSKARDGTLLTQFNMTTVEELGLLKMDFLGLRNLTVIQNALSLIEKKHGLAIDINGIGTDDLSVYRYISTGNTGGVFQLESSGMQDFMKELKPQCFEDIIAGIALYRPGPMDFIPDYIKGKNNPDEIHYRTEKLEPILKDTYGCIVYQEQVMRIVRDLAGFSLGRSDLVRRAMSKKKSDVMQKERHNFVYGNPDENIPGCIANRISEKAANEIYDDMTGFAEYAFNKSHAAAYAVITYQTAYLKYYYPAEYCAALITSKTNDLTKVFEYMREAEKRGVKVLPPDINAGLPYFNVEGGAIVYGLSAVKNVGASAINAVVDERNKNGDYRSLEDFCRRNAGSGVNKRAVENLIKAGAFDSLGINRRQALEIYPEFMSSASKSEKKNIKGQMSFFDFIEENTGLSSPVPDIPEFSKDEILDMEKDVLGLYLSGHPLDRFKEGWSEITTVSGEDFRRDEEDGSIRLKDRSDATAGGIVCSVKNITTKKGEPMAFATLEDFTGQFEVLVFPSVYNQVKSCLHEGKKVLVEGRLSVEDEKNAKIAADDILDISEMINSGEVLEYIDCSREMGFDTER